MTLKEKFTEIGRKLNDHSIAVSQHTSMCEEIADDYAIEFAEWFWYHGRKYWRGERTDYLDMSEILKIYKKERGL